MRGSSSQVSSPSPMPRGLLRQGGAPGQGAGPGAVVSLQVSPSGAAGRGRPAAGWTAAAGGEPAEPAGSDARRGRAAAAQAWVTPWPCWSAAADTKLPPRGQCPPGRRLATGTASRPHCGREGSWPGPGRGGRCGQTLGSHAVPVPGPCFGPTHGPGGTGHVYRRLIVSSKKRLNQASSICALGPPGQNRTAPGGTQPPANP